MMKNILKSGYNFLGILEADDVKDKEMKGQMKIIHQKGQNCTKVKVKWREYDFEH